MPGSVDSARCPASSAGGPGQSTVELEWEDVERIAFQGVAPLGAQPILPEQRVEPGLLPLDGQQRLRVALLGVPGLALEEVISALGAAGMQVRASDFSFGTSLTTVANDAQVRWLSEQGWVRSISAVHRD